jgi:protocatechuate 3,4-dioxygenase beta subunit
MTVVTHNDPNAGDPRLKAIHARVVEKLKEVVREFAITQDELHAAGDFLNRLGKAGMCRSLVDVSLAMTSVDVTMDKAGTRPNLEGPFHKDGAPERADGNLLEHAMPGAPMLALSGTVTDSATGAPIANAVVDIWQADHQGHYDREGFHLSGRMRTDDQGRYRVETVVPLDYSDHDHDPIGELYRAMGRHNRRAAHIHLKLWVDEVERLNTQLFIPGNPYLDTDYVEGAVSDDLILNMRPAGENHFTATFDIAVARAAAQQAA